MFEKVNKAYEFLCTKSAKVVDGPDPENIILILKTQSILFNRHKEGNYVMTSEFVDFHLVLSVLKIDTCTAKLKICSVLKYDEQCPLPPSNGK